MERRATRKSMTWRTGTLGALASALFLCACGGDEQAPDPEAVDILDPAQEHYGKSYADWAGAWVQYTNDTAPPECLNPINDTTGAGCQLYQDEDSPVFMLAGNYGGVSIRDQCVVPKGKALFFPITQISGDNAGVPEDMLLTEAELRAYVDSGFAHMRVESLAVDGHRIDRPERGGVDGALYTLELAPGENIYECVMIEGVEGEFTGYTSGYFAMLAPLDSGQHTISFKAEHTDSDESQSVNIDVTYELTVE